MKVSICMVMMAFCLSSLIQAYAVKASSFCNLPCPAACKQRRNCDATSCICSCDCSGNTQVPDPRQRPTKSPTPTSNAPKTPSFQYTRERQQPFLSDQIQCCVQAGTKMGTCGIYIGLAFLDPTLNFGSYCCGVLKDLQQCCVNGFIPSHVPPINIYSIDLDAHCQ